MFPASIILARDSVAQQLVGARGDDPVVLPVEPKPDRHRTRHAAAAGLRLLADRLSPRESRPAAVR